MTGIIGLILAIAILIIFAYRGLGALPLAILGALVAAIFNGMPLWETFAKSFVPGYASAFTSYMLLFVSSAFYAKLMEHSGCATAIGTKFVDWFGTKHVILVGILIIAALCYGGLSLFVVVFAVMPILFMMFKAANLPRHLTIICVVGGSSTFVMTCLPGSPQLSNVVPTEFLHTSLTAAPLLGTVCGIVLFIMIALYGNWAAKKAVERGEVWTYPDNVDASMYEVNKSELPPAWKGFLVIIVLISMIVIGSHLGINATALAVCATLVASILVVIFNLKKFAIGFDAWLKMLTTGMTNGIAAIGGIAAIIGFGTVVRATPAFNITTKWLLGMHMNPYVLGVVCTGIICAITGGSSSGQRIMYDALAPSLIGTGANLEIMHRLNAIASGSLDKLPHSSGLFMMFEVLGLNHKSAYRHVFACVVCELIVTIVVTAAVVLLGI